MATKKCKVCSEEFEPRNIGSTTIRTNKCLACIGIANLAKIKKDVVAKKKEGLLTVSDYMKLAQGVFNKYIRERDKGLPCISCGAKKYTPSCGHYYPSGTYKSVTFDEDNCSVQCWFNCNSSKSGSLIEYRKGLIERIGIERLEALEQRAMKTKKWTIPELKELITLYKQKLKEIQS